MKLLPATRDRWPSRGSRSCATSSSRPAATRPRSWCATSNSRRSARWSTSSRCPTWRSSGSTPVSATPCSPEEKKRPRPDVIVRPHLRAGVDAVRVVRGLRRGEGEATGHAQGQRGLPSGGGTVAVVTRRAPRIPRRRWASSRASWAPAARGRARGLRVRAELQDEVAGKTLEVRSRSRSRRAPGARRPRRRASSPPSPPLARAAGDAGAVAGAAGIVVAGRAALGARS